MNCKYLYKYLSSEKYVIIFYHNHKRIMEIRYLELRLFIVSFISKVGYNLYSDKSSFHLGLSLTLLNEGWST